ncbi:MAG: MBL fold metallo-hydrolase [Eubacteriales bacterium]|jgi:phosphoribosyl 1,2-cyclic phosphodiesterase
MVEFCSLFSSSSGNCEYLAADGEGLLIDAGASCKQILQALEGVGASPQRIRGVLVTHEHIDHVKGLSVLCRKLHIPLYANEPTARALNIPKLESLDVRVFSMERPFWVGEAEVHPFALSHDSAAPVGYRVEFPRQGVQVGVATDTGCVTQEIRQGLQGCDALLLEANHDRNMLMSGGYPYFLKRRILSQQGHLCNDDCGELAVQLVEQGARHVVLGHLSRENNLPEIAYLAVKQQLEKAGVRLEEDCTLQVAPDAAPSRMIQL